MAVREEAPPMPFVPRSCRQILRALTLLVCLSLAVAIGFTDAFPAIPMIRAGTVITTVPEEVRASPVNLVVDDLFTYFGDSGGPVLDLQGRVIGLVDAGGPVTVRGVTLEISYETSYASLLPLAQRILATGSNIVRPDPGFGGVTMTAELANRSGLPRTGGVLALRVDLHSPATQAGMIVGDIVTAVDDTPTPDVSTLVALIDRHQPGDHVTVSFVDPAGGLHTAGLTLAGA
jgi:S1-C subfamily serine protease